MATNYNHPSITGGTKLLRMNDWNNNVYHIYYEVGPHRMPRLYCSTRANANQVPHGSIVAHLPDLIRYGGTEHPAKIWISCPKCLEIYQEYIKRGQDS